MNLDIVTDNHIIDEIIKSRKVNCMAINIYTKEKCPVCCSNFDRKLNCPLHHGVRPQRVFIQITGNINKARKARIYSTPEGDPLTLANAAGLISRMERELHINSFNIKYYIPKKKNELLWKNYYQKYRKHLEFRNSLDQEDNKWISASFINANKSINKIYILPQFGELYLNEIKSSLFEDYISFLPKSAAIKSNIVRHLSHFLNYAIRNEDIPPLSFKLPQVEYNPKPIRTMTVAQQLEVIKEISSTYRPLIMFGTMTGRRVNELRAFKVKDFDFKKNIYTINGAFDLETYKPFPKVKSKQGEQFPLTDELKEIVKSAIAESKRNAKREQLFPDDFLFLNQKGAHIGHSVLSRKFAETVDKLNYRITLNQFMRHSWATQKLDDGWTFDQISIFLSNDSSQVKESYTNVTTITKENIIKMKAQEKASDRDSAGTEKSYD